MAVTQTATETQQRTNTQPDADSSRAPSRTVAERILVDDQETPLQEREAVSYGAVMAADIEPRDSWNFVVIADHPTEDRSLVAFVRAVDAAAAACRAAEWVSQTRLDWSGDPVATDFSVFEHDHGRREAPGGGDW